MIEKVNKEIEKRLERRKQLDWTSYTSCGAEGVLKQIEENEAELKRLRAKRNELNK